MATSVFHVPKVYRMSTILGDFLGFATTWHWHVGFKLVKFILIFHFSYLYFSNWIYFSKVLLSFTNFNWSICDCFVSFETSYSYSEEICIITLFYENSMIEKVTDIPTYSKLIFQTILIYLESYCRIQTFFGVGEVPTKF